MILLCAFVFIYFLFSAIRAPVPLVFVHTVYVGLAVSWRWGAREPLIHITVRLMLKLTRLLSPPGFLQVAELPAAINSSSVHLPLRQRWEGNKRGSKGALH